MVTVSLPINLFDGDGFLWDIQGDGAISNGTIDAYDGGLDITGFPFFSQGQTEDNGREVAIGPATNNSNIRITRKIYVPDDQGWARFLTTVTNTGTTATTYNLSFTTSLGSDSGTQAIGTSSGDTVFDVNDDWIVTDDSSNGGGDPTMLHIVAGAGGINPSTASRSSDIINFTYNLGLTPGESKTVMIFAAQNQNQATALAKAPTLTGLGIGALEGMSSAELASVVNFATEGLFINNATVVEGNNGITNVDLTVNLVRGTNNQNQVVTVNYGTANGTATTGDNDYLPTNGTLTFQPNETTKTITVPVVGDVKGEFTETFSVNLSNATNSTITDGTGIVTIENDDLIDVDIELSLLIDASGSVDNNEYVLQISGYADAFDNPNLFNNLISQGINGQIAVNMVLWSSSNQQVESVPWTLIDSVASSQAFAQTIRNTLLEAFGGSRPFAGNTAPGSGINFAVPLFFNNDFDGRRLTIDVSGDGAENDGASTATARNNALAAGIDAINGIVIGNEFGLLDFYQDNVIGGTNADGSPAFALEANTFQQFASVLETKLEGELTPLVINIDDVTLTEGNSGTKNFVFTVSLNRTPGQNLTLNYNTSGVTATQGTDYTATSGTLTFGSGETTKTITVPVIGDQIVELDETFFVNLTNNNIGDIQDGQGLGTITNDDSATFSINDVSQVEGNSGNTNFVFNVTLNNNVDTAVNIDFATSNGTALISDNDYLANSGTVNFAGSAGETKNITVSVVGDTKFEADENFFVNLSNIVANGRNVNFLDSTGIGTILNDDQQSGVATLSINNSTINEDSGSLLFTVTLTGSTNPFTVDFATNNGTALTGDNDYTASSGTLNFSGTNGETLTISVPVIADSKVELDETLTVLLSNIVGSGNIPTINDGTGLGTIVNDDSATFSINNVSQVEGNSGNTDFVLTVTLDNEVDAGVNVNFATSDGTALISDNDYLANSGTLNFAGNAGETKNVTVSVVGDTKFEPNEDFLVNLSNISASGRDVSFADPTGIGTILNDDQPNNDILGTPARDILTGNQNDNTINGFGGADRITTGAGNDTLIYQNFRDLGDTIIDFEVGSDQFDLSQLLQSVGYAGNDPIADGYISFGATGTTGVVLFDRDGVGGSRAYPFIFVEGTTLTELSNPNNFVFS